MAASRPFLSDDVRSVKLILLLVKGGTLVAKKLIMKILDKSIDDYLNDNEDKLKFARKNKHITEKQMNILFPGSLQPTDLECWDISLFSYILLHLFKDKLEGYEKVAIKALRDKRNDMSHLTSFAMSEVQLMREWTHLTKVLFQLSRGLTTAEEEDINDTFDDILTITDFNVAKQKLEPFEGSDELLHQIVTEKLVSHDQKFEEIFNFMDKARASNETVDIMARILVNALTPAEGDAAQAELLNALKQIVFGGQQQTDGHNQHDEQYQTGGDLVLIATKNIVSDIKDNGVDIVTVEKGSILVTIRCPTISALKNISQYLANRMYEERLVELEIALSKHVGSPVKLNISIVLETLDSALMQIEKDANNKSIVLQLKCRGSEGVKKAVDYFYNGSSTNAFNSLSEALSRSVDNKIELHTEIDVDKLEKDIEERKHQSPVDGHHSAKESAVPKLDTFRSLEGLVDRRKFMRDLMDTDRSSENLYPRWTTMEEFQDIPIGLASRLEEDMKFISDLTDIYINVEHLEDRRKVMQGKQDQHNKQGQTSVQGQSELEKASTQLLANMRDEDVDIVNVEEG